MLGERHPDYAQSLNNLAALLRAQGDYAAAKPLYEQALAIRKAVLGERHADTAGSLNNLAELLSAQGDYAAAKPLHEQALAIFKESLGARHPLTAQSLNNLAVLLDDQGDYAAAKPLFEQALAIRKAALGAHHPLTAQSLNNLAVLLYEQGDYAAARPLHEQALAINKAVSGKHHPDYALSLNNLALLLSAQGDLAGAEPLLNQALDINRGNLELAAAAQAERQQLAMAQALRSGLDAYLSLALDAHRPGEPAYRQVLAWKGAVFARQRWSRNQRRLLQADRQPEVARLVSDLRDTITRLATLALTTPDPKQLEAWHRQVADLTVRKEALEAELSRRSAAFHRERAREQTTPAQVQAALPRDTALIDFLEYTRFSPPAEGKGELRRERRLVAFVVRPDRPLVLLDLGPLGPIAAAVDQWLPRLRRGVTAPGPDDPAVTLRRRVWQPLAAHLEGVRTVLVSPDGALAQLPLGALPGQQPGTYLIEEVALAVVPVPQALPALLAEWGKPPVQGRRPRAQGPRCCWLGTSITAPAPVRPTPAARAGPPPPMPAPVRSLASAGWRPPAARSRPCAMFQRRYPTAPVLDLRGAQATEGTIREQAGHHRWIHLATHGFFAPRRCAPP